MLWGERSCYFLAFCPFSNIIGFVQCLSVMSFSDWKSSWNWHRLCVTLFLYCKAIYQTWSNVVKENYSNSQIDPDECVPTLSTHWVSLKGEFWIPNKPWHASACSWTRPPSSSSLLKGTVLELPQARRFTGVNFLTPTRLLCRNIWVFKL